jgi:hypothetical protein
MKNQVLAPITPIHTFLITTPPANFLQLIDSIPPPPEKELLFLRQFGFMQLIPNCPHCGNLLKKYQHHTYHNDYCYQCLECKERYPLYFESIFREFNVPLFKVLIAFYCFSEYTLLVNTITQSELSKKTCKHIFHLLRQCCQKYVESQSYRKIGGPDDSVQVDETHISKNKYNVGRNSVTIG